MNNLNFDLLTKIWLILTFKTKILTLQQQFWQFLTNFDKFL